MESELKKSQIFGIHTQIYTENFILLKERPNHNWYIFHTFCSQSVNEKAYIHVCSIYNKEPLR